MPRGIHLDLDRIHRQLWDRSDRLNRLRINQNELAEELDITKFTMSRVITKLVEQERIRQVSSKRQHSGMFVVTGPDEWKEQHDEW